VSCAADDVLRRGAARSPYTAPGNDFDWRPPIHPRRAHHLIAPSAATAGVPEQLAGRHTAQRHRNFRRPVRVDERAGVRACLLGRGHQILERHSLIRRKLTTRLSRGVSPAFRAPATCLPLTQRG
jgi:hypothetical protein